MKKISLSFIVGMFLIPSILAGNLTLFPNPGEANVYISYEFNFSNASNCLQENIILSHSVIIHTNTRGFGFVSIDISNLTEIPIRLCEYKDNLLRANHSFSSIISQSTYSQNLNLSGNAIIKGWVNVTGNVTAKYFIGNGSQLTDISTSSIPDIWVNQSGDIMSGDLNMSLNKLTTIGELIMAGIIRGQNITPLTTNLYSLGNSTNWFKSLYVKTIHSSDINTTNLNVTNIRSDEINTTNLTIAGYNITEKSGDLVISLT